MWLNIIAAHEPGDRCLSAGGSDSFVCLYVNAVTTIHTASLTPNGQRQFFSIKALMRELNDYLSISQTKPKTFYRPPGSRQLQFLISGMWEAETWATNSVLTHPVRRLRKSQTDMAELYMPYKSNG